MADARRYSVESNTEWTDDPENNSSPAWAAPEYGFAVESEDRSYSRRRSIECAAVRIDIVDTEIDQDHTEYLIKAICGIRTWVIKRRYKDFDFLDRQLKKYQPADLFPPLPPKRYLRSSNDPTIVDKRKEQLQTYLSTLISIPPIWNTNDLVLFLNDESNIMMFIWNVDRMRRLKDTLRLANTTQQSDTARLNSDLADAQRQVLALQERLSQMEMIFLQQATGVAAHQLSSAVMRSLSRADNPLSMQLASEITEEQAALYYSDEATGTDQEIIGPAATGASTTATIAAENEEPMQPADVLKAVNLAQRSEDVASYIRTNKPTTADEARTLTVSFELQEVIRMSEMLAADSSPSKTQRSISKDNTAELDQRMKSATGSEAIRSLQENATQPWVQALCQACDPIIAALLPTAVALDQRMKIFKFVRELVCRTSGTQLFPAGSFISHTFLPDGDIDSTVFMPKMLDDSWYVKINEALCLSAFNSASGEDFTVSNVSYLNAEIKMIRSLINGVSVDITTNQLTTLHMEALLERVDESVGQQHLFKRSLLLVKAWMAWEFDKYADHHQQQQQQQQPSSSSPSSQQPQQQQQQQQSGRKGLSTQALILLLIFTFNKEGQHISHPLQALVHMLDVFLKFDWTGMVVTIRGPLSRGDVDNAAALNLLQSSGFIPESVLDMTIKDEIRAEKAIIKQSSSYSATSSLPASNNNNNSSNNEEDTAPLTVNTSDSMDISTSAAAETPTVGGSNTSPKPFGTVKRPFRIGTLNLVDPFQCDRNVLEAIDAADCDLIVSVFLEAYKHLQSVCQEMMIAATTATGPRSDMAEGVVKGLFGNTIHRYGVKAATPATAAQIAASGVMPAAKLDMHFARCYGSIAMNGRIELATLTQVVLIVLDKKGPMPVGEIGKNLAAVFGCDNLSRRLKDQFTGLKRAIENASTTRLRVGTEHQFNPVVCLIGEGSVLLDVSDSPWCFHHAAFLFTPYQVNLQLQTQVVREQQMRTQQMQQGQQSQHGGGGGGGGGGGYSGMPGQRYSGNNNNRRQYGGYGYAGGGGSDAMSLSSMSSSNTDRRGGGGGGYGGNMAGSPGTRGGYSTMRSPNRPMGNSGGMQQMMPPSLPIMTFDPNMGQYFPPGAMFPPPPPAAMYQQHPMQMPPPPPYAYYHNSMASSLSSSYGGPGAMMGGNASPMSQSPAPSSLMGPPQVMMPMSMPPPMPQHGHQVQGQYPLYQGDDDN